MPPCYTKKVSTSDIYEVESFVDEVGNCSTNRDASMAKLIFDLGYNLCVHEVESSPQCGNFIDEVEHFIESLAWEVRCRFWLPLGCL